MVFADRLTCSGPIIRSDDRRDGVSTRLTYLYEFLMSNDRSLAIFTDQ
jgi:hypothetical protein